MECSSCLKRPWLRGADSPQAGRRSVWSSRGLPGTECGSMAPWTWHWPTTIGFMMFHVSSVFRELKCSAGLFLSAECEEMNRNELLHAGCLGSDDMSNPLLLQRVLDTECLTPSLQRYTTALCRSRKNWRLASLLLEELSRTRLEANSFSYTATISSCEKAATWIIAQWCRMAILRTAIFFSI